MNKKYYVVGVIILVLIGASLFFIIQSNNNKNESDYGQNFYYLAAKAINESNPNICAQEKGYVMNAGDVIYTVSEIEAKNGCYRIYATTKLDINVCDKISQGAKPDKCTAYEQYSECIHETQKSLGIFSKENCDKIKLRELGCEGYSGIYLLACAKVVVNATNNTSVCDAYFEKNTEHWNTCINGSE